MSIHVKTITTVSCDGSEDRPCPRESAASYPFPQTVALRMARKEGWTVEGLTVCPPCSDVEATMPAVCVPPIVSHRLGRVIQGHDAVHESRSFRRTQAASRSIGSSSASCS